MTNTTKHTKGPWEVVNDAGLTIQAPLMTVCMDNSIDAKKRPKENKANFNLIAAAPDMIEALKEVLSSLDCTSGFMHISPEAITKTRQAIAKAEGKE
jgi:hypothetical protein